MKPSTKNRAKGKFHEVKGKVKEKVAHALDDQRRESEGRREKEAGTIQKEIGEPEDIDAGEAPLSYARRRGPSAVGGKTGASSPSRIDSSHHGVRRMIARLM